jgi:hypothetical protein
MSTIRCLALSLLLAPGLLAVETRAWDEMIGTYEHGDVTVVTKAGKKVRYRGGTWFRGSMIQVAAGHGIPRGDVREVVVREVRQDCCEALQLGAEIGVVLVAGLFVHPKETWQTVGPLILIFLPISVVSTAVTGPPLLVVEGVRHLKPAGILYRVVP